MGCGISKRHHRGREKEGELRDKIRALEEQIKELKSARDDHEKWKRPRDEDDEGHQSARRPSRPKLKYLTEEEERLRWLAAASSSSSSSSEKKMQQRSEWCIRRPDELVVEQMTTEEERDEAGEKWKQLYLAIKAELDLLIHRTQRVEKIEAALGLMRKGERFDWKAEELMMEWHAKELRAQEEMVETLRARVAAMEEEEAKRDREMDILRQSLKILATKKQRRVT